MLEKIEEFLVYMKDIKQLSHNTLTSYEQDLAKLYEYMISHDIVLLDRVSETMINSYIIDMEKKFSSATVARNIVTLKSFFSYLVKKHELEQDPCERIKTPKVDKKQPNILKVEEIERLLSAPDIATPKGLRDKAMFELMYATGMKASELIALEIDDIDFLHGIIICRNEKKERIIPFGKYAGEVVTAYLEDGRKRFAGLQSHRYLFVNQNGHPLTRQGFWKILKEYAILLDIQNLSPQILRHSFAAHLIENGANVNTVGEILGYSDSSLAYSYTTRKNGRVLEEYHRSHPRA